MASPSIEERMRTALRSAMRSRDPVATAALRSALAAIGNATAVPSVAPPAAGDEHFAGSAVGVGAAEAPRRELTEDDVAGILRTEIADRRTAADQYGPGAAADRLRAEADALRPYLPDPLVSP